MRKELNSIIHDAEKCRGLKMPRIGEGHSGFPGGIFSLLQDPGGEHTTSTGAMDSGCVDIDNDDQTAKWIKKLLCRLQIPKSAITPWNAFGAYGEKPSVAKLNENLPLCQALLDKAQPIAVIAQGAWAQKMADLLRKEGFAGPIHRVRHPSRSSKDGRKDIEAAFLCASKLLTR